MVELKMYEYNGTQIEFEVIDGHIKANATLMAKAFGKKPDDIIRTKQWSDFENALLEDRADLRFADIRSVNNGNNGGTWIHEELVIEFARKLDPKFALWCNRKIAEISKNNIEKSISLSPAELLLQTAQILVQHEKRFSTIELKQIQTDDRVLKLESKVNTRPNYFTVIGFGITKGLSLTMAKAKELGKLASTKCRELGYEVEKVKDTRFGFVNSYPDVILQEVFNQVA
jgi:hypothetical protein